MKKNHFFLQIFRCHLSIKIYLRINLRLEQHENHSKKLQYIVSNVTFVIINLLISDFISSTYKNVKNNLQISRCNTVSNSRIKLPSHSCNAESPTRRAFSTQHIPVGDTRRDSGSPYRRRILRNFTILFHPHTHKTIFTPVIVQAITKKKKNGGRNATIERAVIGRRYKQITAFNKTAR